MSDALDLHRVRLGAAAMLLDRTDHLLAEKDGQIQLLKEELRAISIHAVGTCACGSLPACFEAIRRHLFAAQDLVRQP